MQHGFAYPALQPVQIKLAFVNESHFVLFHSNPFVCPIYLPAGTSAILVTGTGVNEIVQLDGKSKCVLDGRDGFSWIANDEESCNFDAGLWKTTPAFCPSSRLACFFISRRVSWLPVSNPGSAPARRFFVNSGDFPLNPVTRERQLHCIF